MTRTFVFIVAGLALGCTPEAGTQQNPLGDGARDAGMSGERGVLCEPSWTTPLRIASEGQEAVGALRASLDGSGLHLALDAHDGVGIGDVYLALGVPPHLYRTQANSTPWRTGWLDEVTVDVPREHLAGPCGADLKIIVSARVRVRSGIQWVFAEGSNALGAYGSHDLRSLCCGEPPEEDADGDGHLPPEDCDDGDASVHPGVDEIPYDGVDQDCDRHDYLLIDEEVIARAASSSLDVAYLADGTALRSWSTSGRDVSQLVSPTGEVLVTFPMSGLVASDGARFLLVYGEARSTRSDTFGIFVYQDGSANPSAFQITDPADAGGSPVDVAYVDGHYLVVTASPDDLVDDSFNGVLVSQRGGVGAEFDVSTTIAPGLGAPHIVTDGERFLVAYTNPDGPGGNTEVYTGADYALLARLVDPLAGPVGDELALVTRDGVFGAIRVASNGSSYLAVYQSATLADPISDVHGQLFDLDGAPIGSEIVVEADPSSQREPQVFALDRGYAVAWVDDRFAPDFEADHRAVFVQRVSATGELFGDAEIVMASLPHTYEDLRFFPDAPDGMLAAWVLRGADLTLFTATLDL